MKGNDFKELLAKCFGKNKDDKHHAGAMLIIYAIFILVLVIMIRTSPTKEASNNANNNSSNNSTNTINLNNNSTNKDLKPTATPKQSVNYDVNYSYVYTIVENDNKVVISGKKLDDKEIFTLIDTNGSKDYAKLSDNYLLKENGEYHICDSPNNNLIYTNMDKIENLVQISNYTINGNSYIYSVSISEILKEFNRDSNINIPNDVYDTIILNVENDTLKSVELNLNNYYVNMYGTGTLNIKMEFNNIGSTEDFDVSISS